MKRAVLVALLSLALPLAARAQDAADDAKKAAVLEEARQHVAKAKVHYDLGEFKEAADEYIIVYRLRPIPALLFNIAQAYRQGGLYEKARQFYKSYLRESPDAKNKGMIQQAIKEMDELLAKEKRTREAKPTGVQEAAEASLPMPAKTASPAQPPPAPAAAAKPPPELPPPDAAKVAKPVKPEPKRADLPAAGWPTSKPAVVALATSAPAPPKALPSPQPASPPAHAAEGGGTRVLPWVVAGASVALLGGGGFFYTKASSTDSELQSTLHPRAEADQLISQSKSNHMLSAVLLGAGAAAAVGSAVLFFAF